MIGGLLKSFPDGYTPNPAQVKLLKNIDQAFDDGYKVVVCNAPTGSGKSTILRSIYMDVKIKKGKIIYKNNDLTKLKKRQIPMLRRDIGMIFKITNYLKIELYMIMWLSHYKFLDTKIV